MLYVTVGTANNDGAGIYHQDHSSVIVGRMPARARFRIRVPTERDLARG